MKDEGGAGARAGMIHVILAARIYSRSASGSHMSHPSTNSQTARAWYRPHRASIALALVMAGLFVVLNASGFARVSGAGALRWQNGWPFVVLWRSVYSIGGGDFGLAWVARPSGNLDDGHFSLHALLGNLLVAMAAVAMLTALAERRFGRFPYGIARL